jgi:hypothetical protein
MESQQQQQQIVRQLRSLAADAENRAYIVKDKTCFLGLVKFLDSEDTEVVFLALETLQFLTLRLENRDIMVQTSPNLTPTLRK